MDYLITFLGAFATRGGGGGGKFAQSVGPSVVWNTRIAGRIFMKMYTGEFYEKLTRHVNFPLHRICLTTTLHEDLHVILRAYLAKYLAQRKCFEQTL
jgi:hypothetical protein